MLNEGSKVTVVQANFGYTKVTTEDGTTGFVSSDDLKPAPPEAPPSSKPRTAASSGRPKRSNLQPTPGSPLFELGDLPPLPEKNDPSKPAPSFRF